MSEQEQTAYIILVSLARLQYRAGADYSQICTMKDLRAVYYDALAFCFLLKYLFGLKIKMV